MNLKFTVLIAFLLMIISCGKDIHHAQVTIRNSTTYVIIEECSNWLKNNGYVIQARNKSHVVGKADALNFSFDLSEFGLYREYLEFTVYTYGDSLELWHTGWRVFDEKHWLAKTINFSGESDFQYLREHLDSVCSLLGTK